MQVKTRTISGPFGPHAGKREFYYSGKWHFLKWLSKQELIKYTYDKKEKPL